MIISCKVCQKPIPNKSICKSYSCDCEKYSVIYRTSNTIPESETIKVANYYLCYFPEYKEASIVSINDDRQIMKNIPIDELTHELANQWVGKLKTYVLFQ